MTKLWRRFPLMSLFFVLSVSGICALSPVKIGYLSGCDEYESDKNLSWLMEEMESTYGTENYWIQGQDGQEQVLEGLHVLDSIDVLIIFARRMTLPDSQINRFKDFFNSGKGIVGVRTASHAFQSYLEFDAEVLGGNYRTGDHTAGFDVVLTDSALSHPVTKGVNGFSSAGWLYPNSGLNEDITLLMTGVLGDREEPVTWVRLYDSTRVFYTSTGASPDWQDPDFQRMIINAVFWAADTGSGSSTLSLSPLQKSLSLGTAPDVLFHRCRRIYRAGRSTSLFRDLTGRRQYISM